MELWRHRGRGKEAGGGKRLLQECDGAAIGRSLYFIDLFVCNILYFLNIYFRNRSHKRRTTYCYNISNKETHGESSTSYFTFYCDTWQRDQEAGCGRHAQVRPTIFKREKKELWTRRKIFTYKKDNFWGSLGLWNCNSFRWQQANRVKTSRQKETMTIVPDFAIIISFLLLLCICVDDEKNISTFLSALIFSSYLSAFFALLFSFSASPVSPSIRRRFHQPVTRSQA